MSGRQILAAILLALAVALVFVPLTAHPFLELDDDSYVTRNPHVATGLSRDNVVWAFTAFHSSNWHPLTWISHQLDVSLFGLAPSGHHRTSVILHLANTLLLLLVLRRMTGAFWPSLFVAALFGLHPLRLESVAWVAERKDVLSGLFGLLALLGWAGYAERPTRFRYVATLTAFALGLMAKPSLVALPFVLVLLDVWPLGRSRRARELIPFFTLAAGSSVLTVLAQHAGRSIDSLAAVPMAQRLANALTAYVWYLIKLCWPIDLAVLYPLPKATPSWQWAGAAVILAGASAAVVVLRRRRPWLLVGWLWYLGMLVPTIGLVQVGTQAYADRYTYLPMIGIGIGIAWSGAELVASRPSLRLPLACAAVAALAALCGATLWQERFWSSSERLFERSLAVAPGGGLIHNNYGALLQRAGKREEALSHFRSAIAADPYDVTARKNLGNVLLDLKRPAEAVAELTRVVRQAPDYASGRNRLGVALATVGRGNDALPHLRRAVELEPADPRWREDLVVALLMAHRETEAVPLLEAALAGPGSSTEDRYLLGMARAQFGEFEAAEAAFEAVLAIEPGHARAREQLGAVRARLANR